MLRLALTFFGVISSTLAGTAVTIALVTGVGQTGSLILCALGGAVLGVPVSYVLARAMFDED